MIAAVRRRIGLAPRKAVNEPSSSSPRKRSAPKRGTKPTRLQPARAVKRLRSAPSQARKRLRSLPEDATRWTRQIDRRLNRELMRAHPLVVRWWGRLKALLVRVGHRLRPVAVFTLRLLSAAERRLRSIAALTVGAATRASATVTPERAIGGVILAAAACLVASQFIDYRGVEVGQPGYAGLPNIAVPPTVAVETAGQAHSYLLIPIALLAAALALVAMRRSRPRLGRVVFLLGLLSLGVILLVDLPAGMDVGEQASRFSGASAVLYGGFYGELASAAGLMLGGLLLVMAPKAAARYHARPCRTRINLYARVASGLRRRRPRRASSRGKGARRPSPHRKGGASAPASQP